MISSSLEGEVKKSSSEKQFSFKGAWEIAERHTSLRLPCKCTVLDVWHNIDRYFLCCSALFFVKFQDVVSIRENCWDRPREICSDRQACFRNALQNLIFCACCGTWLNCCTFYRVLYVMWNFISGIYEKIVKFINYPMNSMPWETVFSMK